MEKLLFGVDGTSEVSGIIVREFNQYPTYRRFHSKQGINKKGCILLPNPKGTAILIATATAASALDIPLTRSRLKIAVPLINRFVAKRADRLVY